jgi:6-pyruvoyltetrahydropterin/6-carboxytetrahydropterin synthase
MVMDFGEIKGYLKPLVENFLDYYYLNESLGLENPTSEEVARWVFEQLEKAGMPGLVAVEIRETCTSGAQWNKDNVPQVLQQRSAYLNGHQPYKTEMHSI